MLLAYEDALSTILNSTSPLVREGDTISLAEIGPMRVLAAPVIARDPHPRFDNASVDGYALHAADLSRTATWLPISMSVAAGDDPPAVLDRGFAARIFTGARLPFGTAAVAMQENVDASGATVSLRVPLHRDEGLRRAGADFQVGDCLLGAGAPITPGVAGLLASQGILAQTVAALPQCLIATTGDEVVTPDQEPGPNQLRDSVGPMLCRAAGPYGIAATAYAPDDPRRLEAMLVEASRQYDAIVVAGGASVGDRDYLARKVESSGKIEFHGVNIRPGKPLLFGWVGGKPILGLPGNPASAYVCFHLFGLPLMRRLGGWAKPESLWFNAPYGADHEPEARDVFARVTLAGGVATPMHEQASFGLRSLGEAQALARLPAARRVREGESVWITLL